MSTALPDPDAVLEARRRELEVQKLEAELAALRRPFWQHPGAFVPLTLAAFTMLGAWVAGYFDARRTQLEAEKKILQNQIEGLKKTGSGMVRDLKDANKTLERITAQKEGDLEKLLSLAPPSPPNRNDSRELAKSIRSRLSEIREGLNKNKRELDVLEKSFGSTPSGQ